MRPITMDLNGRTNADFAADWRLTSGGVAIDLTGADARLAVVDANGAMNLHLRVGDGLTLSGASGEIAIRIPAQRMQGLLPGAYAYDLQIRLSSGISVPVAGAFVIDKGVTRV